MPTPVAELELPVYDPALGDRPRQTTAEREAFRDQSWLIRVPFGYQVLNHDDCVAILKDKRWHQAIRFLTALSGVTDEEYLARRERPSILSAEGDEHNRLRRLVSGAFTPRSADRLRPFMRDVINGLLDPVTSTGRVELVSQVCEPYPIPIVCELFGAPKQDWEKFSAWATDIFKIFDADVADHTKTIMAASDAMDDYVERLIEVRRSAPQDDLLSDLIAAEEAGDKLSTAELVMLAEAILLAGTDTTRNQLACALAVFAEHPDQWALLAERPELAPRAAEESLRYLGAVRGTGRYASTDIEYRDIVFPAGRSSSRASSEPTPTQPSSPNLTSSTSPPSGMPDTSHSALACTTALAPTWPGPSCKKRSSSCRSACQTCGSMARWSTSPTPSGFGDRRRSPSPSTPRRTGLPALVPHIVAKPDPWACDWRRC